MLFCVPWWLVACLVLVLATLLSFGLSAYRGTLELLIARAHPLWSNHLTAPVTAVAGAASRPPAVGRLARGRLMKQPQDPRWGRLATAWRLMRRSVACGD